MRYRINFLPVPEEKRIDMVEELCREWTGISEVSNEEGVLWGVEINTDLIEKKLPIIEA